MTKNGNGQCEIGMVGLGVMGRNLLLNMADHGFTVAGFDTDNAKVDSLRTESGENNVYGASNISDFIKLLRAPRAIMLLVPAGQPVDAAINELLPFLGDNDLIIDGGNSHFTDTDKRIVALKKKNIQFIGVGISGGEEGARRGPSIMPGGSKEAYERVRAVFEAVSAKVDGEPCVTYLGSGSAGHYVKMVHNGIEYGIMQLIAETYDVMKRRLGFTNSELQKTYADWNKSELNSYLLEITSHIFAKRDDKTGNRLIDDIRDVAKQKGTGMWTSESAMELQLPVPTIDLAVSMRDLSVFVEERKQAGVLYQLDIPHFTGDKNAFVNQLKSALLTGMIVVYSQGMALLSVASEKYAYDLDLEAVARIWRGGCIIRAKLLEDIRAAFRLNKKLSNLLLDANMAEKFQSHWENLRHVVADASLHGVPTPALMLTLSYVDALRSTWMPANLIQAQRDYFGSHTYERIDMEGTFHTQWT